MRRLSRRYRRASFLDELDSLPEGEAPVDAWDLETYLDLRAEYLGEGAFAQVYEDPTDPKNQVVKFQKHHDPCFEAYVLEVGKDDNPHLPKILAHRELEDGTDVYVLERLRPMPGFSSLIGRLDFPQQVALYTVYHWTQLAFTPLRDLSPDNVTDWLRDQIYEQGSSEWEDPRDILLDYLKSCPDPMCEAAVELVDFIGTAGCEIDLHYENLMVGSDGRVVFTDPFANPAFLPDDDYE